MKKQARVLVSGTVQGVSFRYFVMNMAKKTGVSGWVRNTEDRKVEAVFEGEEESVKEMIDLCRHGPPSAKVGKIEIKWSGFTEGYEGFHLKH